MRALLGLCLLVLGAAPAAAAGSKRPKSRSLSELVSFALQKGTTDPLTLAVGVDLGFRADQPSRTLWYGAQQSSDGVERTLHVILDGKKPWTLIWCTYKEVRQDGEDFYEAYEFRSALDGTLERAAQGGGVGEDAWHRPIELTPEVKKLYERQMRFFLKEAVHLEPNK
jgi:hypothetical protein